MPRMLAMARPGLLLLSLALCAAPAAADPENARGSRVSLHKQSQKGSTHHSSRLDKKLDALAAQKRELRERREPLIEQLKLAEAERAKATGAQKQGMFTANKEIASKISDLSVGIQKLVMKEDALKKKAALSRGKGGGSGGAAPAEAPEPPTALLQEEEVLRPAARVQAAARRVNQLLQMEVNIMETQKVLAKALQDYHQLIQHDDGTDLKDSIRGRLAEEIHKLDEAKEDLAGRRQSLLDQLHESERDTAETGQAGSPDEALSQRVRTLLLQEVDIMETQRILERALQDMKKSSVEQPTPLVFATLPDATPTEDAPPSELIGAPASALTGGRVSDADAEATIKEQLRKRAESSAKLDTWRMQAADLKQKLEDLQKEKDELTEAYKQAEEEAREITDSDLQKQKRTTNMELAKYIDDLVSEEQSILTAQSNLRKKIKRAEKEDSKLQRAITEVRNQHQREIRQEIRRQIEEKAPPLLMEAERLKEEAAQLIERAERAKAEAAAKLEEEKKLREQINELVAEDAKEEKDAFEADSENMRKRVKARKDKMLKQMEARVEAEKKLAPQITSDGEEPEQQLLGFPRGKPQVAPREEATAVKDVFPGQDEPFEDEQALNDDQPDAAE